MQEKCISNGDEIGDENEVGIMFIPGYPPWYNWCWLPGITFGDGLLRGDMGVKIPQYSPRRFIHSQPTHFIPDTRQQNNFALLGILLYC